MIKNKLITKKNYINFTFCHRSFFYSFYHKKKAKNDDKKQIEDLKLISKLIYKHLNVYNLNKIYKNKNTIKKVLREFKTIANINVIYENLSCQIDILKNNNDDEDSCDVYKIKACNSITKYIDECCTDLAFQKYILTKNNIRIKNTYIIYLNPNYIRNGDIEPDKLFIFHKIDDNKILEKSKYIKKNIEDIKEIIKNKKIKQRSDCKSDCVFFEYCHINLPKPNVTDINGIKKNYAHELIKKNIVTFEDLKKNKIIFKNKRQQIQVNTYLKKRKNSVNKELLKKFLCKINYPLYYLDFETMCEAIPPFDGTTTYEQIPFQYSLHIEKKKGSKLIHKKFIGSKIDCVEELTKKLIKDIPKNVCIISFHSLTEKNIIKKLAQKFPKMSEHLKNIESNIIDLLEPFKKGYYYHSMQGNSNSIKTILPALCPKMKNSYKKLKNIHDGSEALRMFPKLINMLNNKNIKKYQKIRKEMLKYCYLDTLSMNKILNVLYESLKENEL